MVSIKLSVFVAFVAMVTLAVSVQGEGKCNFDKAEKEAKEEQFKECYLETTGETPPKDKAELAKIDKTVFTEVFVCMGKKDGTIEEDGKTINIDKCKELVNNSNLSDDVKTALNDGTQDCYHEYQKNEDLSKFFKCVRMVYMDACM